MRSFHTNSQEAFYKQNIKYYSWVVHSPIPTGWQLRIPVNLNSDSGICEHHFRKVCGQGFCEQKLSFEGRHLFDSPNKGSVPAEGEMTP